MRRDLWGAVLVHSGRVVTLLGIVAGLLFGWVLSEGSHGFFPTGFLFGFMGLGTVGFGLSGAGYRLCRKSWFERTGVRVQGLLLGMAYFFLLLLVVIG